MVAEPTAGLNFQAQWLVTAVTTFEVSTVGESNLVVSAVVIFEDSSYLVITQVRPNAAISKLRCSWLLEVF